MNKQTELSWRVDQVWNASFEEDIERKPLKKRDGTEYPARIWASELGKAPVDVFLKMQGLEPTNPPDARALRKMEAGNIWEHIITFVLSRAGIMKQAQEWTDYQYDGLLQVGGYLDVLAGGSINFEKAKGLMEDDFNWLPDRTKHAFVKVIENLEELGTLKTIVIEVKSCSAFMYDVYKSKGRPSENHELQLFHYLKAKNLNEGHILYISRDDARMLEFGVTNPSPIEDLYKERIEVITDYHNKNERPPLEKPIVLDEDDFRFRTNWKVMYSDYLTMLYGYEHQEEFREIFDKKVNGYNRVFKRIVQGKNMTDKNLEIIKSMKKDFPKYEDYVEPAIKSNKFSESEEE